MPTISWTIKDATMTIGREASAAYSEDAAIREEIIRDAQVFANVRGGRVEVQDADEFPLFAAEPES